METKVVKRETGKDWTRTCIDLSPGTKLTNKQRTKNRTRRMVSTVTATASVTEKKEENRWPQTANIAHHKKTPLNEKATRKTRSSSHSLHFYLVLLVSCMTAHTALSPSEGCHDSFSTLSLSPLRAGGSAESALLRHKHFFILFISSSSLSSRRTIPLLGIKGAKWGHAFIRQQLECTPV